MRLPRDEAEALRRLEDEAIEANKAAGSVTHVAAAVDLQESLRSLEAGGITWAAAVRNDAEVGGLVSRVKRRIKERKAFLPSGAGAGRVIVPASYSRTADDGSVQLCLWWELPLSDLVDLIESIERQVATLTDRSMAMRYGLDLARRHGVDTAAEGFAAEGINLTGEAAA